MFVYIYGLSNGGFNKSYLRDTLAVLATEQNSPGDTAGVLALGKQRLGLARAETEDLAVATDKDLALYKVCQYDIPILRYIAGIPRNAKIDTKSNPFE